MSRTYLSMEQSRSHRHRTHTHTRGKCTSNRLIPQRASYGGTASGLDEWANPHANITIHVNPHTFGNLDGWSRLVGHRVSHARVSQVNHGLTGRAPMGACAFVGHRDMARAALHTASSTSSKGCASRSAHSATRLLLGPATHIEFPTCLIPPSAAVHERLLISGSGMTRARATF